MTNPGTPLSPDTIASIREEAPVAEEQGSLTTRQLDLIYREKWFHLFVPEAFGGLGLSLPEAVRLEDNIAEADGSMGWVVTLCAGAAMFIGYLESDLAHDIFSVPYRVCLAGSGQATGTAKNTVDGFTVNGLWPYASGAPHATHFTANCMVEESGTVQSFLFTKEEVTLHPNWKYIGLNGTAGYSFSVTNLRVPANRSFIIDPGRAKLPHPVYRYPFLQLAETTIAANIAGMCRHFFTLAEPLLAKKESTHPRSQRVKNKGLELLASAMAETERLRREFYTALDDSWLSHVDNKAIPPAQLAAVSRRSLQLAQQARSLVNQLYPYCGLHAARTDTAINRVWRDINTASQHTLLLDAV